MTSQAYEFLSLGEALVDLISKDVVGSLGEARNFQRFAGGQVTNLAINMARLGRRAAIAACVGDDGLGQFLQQQINQAGVLTDLIQVADEFPTTVVIVTRQTQTPDFIVHRGADSQLRPSPTLSAALAASRIVHTSAFALSRQPARSTILEGLKTAHQMGNLVSLDPNYHPRLGTDTKDFLRILKDVYAFVDVTKPSLDDCARIFGPDLTPAEYAGHFLEWGAKIVILTMGDRGVYLATAEGEHYHVHANKIPVADVTGAGDAFWAGFLIAWLDGLPQLNAALFGQVMAEIKISTVGPLSQYPDLELLSQRAQIVNYVKHPT